MFTFRKLIRLRKRPLNPHGHVYYARLSTANGVFYKVGWTRKATLFERMAFNKMGDEKLIDKEFRFTFLQNGWDVEQDLHDHFAKQRAFPRGDPSQPLYGCGQTELFRGDILGLDESLYESLVPLPPQPLGGKDKEPMRTKLSSDGEGCLYVLVGLVLAPFTLGLSLFFVVGGLSEIFGSGPPAASTSPTEHAGVRRKRPVHPPKIQALVDSLKGI